MIVNVCVKFRDRQHPTLNIDTHLLLVLSDHVQTVGLYLVDPTTDNNNGLLSIAAN